LADFGTEASALPLLPLLLLLAEAVVETDAVVGAPELHGLLPMREAEELNDQAASLSEGKSSSHPRWLNDADEELAVRRQESMAN